MDKVENDETLVAPAPEANEPVSQRDEVHNDVAAAIKQLKGDGDPAPEPEPLEPDAGEQKPDRARGPDGKFLAKDAAPAQAAPDADPKLPPVDNTAKPSIEQPSTAVSAAPVSWAADAKTVWNSLPPAVQQAVIKRETEVSNGFRQKSEEVRRYEQTFAPLVEEARKIGVAPDAGLNAMLSMHRMLSNPQTAPQAIAQLAQQAGVDLANLASNPPAPQPQQFDPMVSHLTQTVSQLENQLNGFLQNQTMSVVDKFAQDHPHYAAVEASLVHIIPVVQQANPGLSAADVLEKAYEQAIWINPDVRAQLIAEQTAKTQAAQTEALQAKANNAKRAAVSIKGSSNGAAPMPKAPVSNDGSVYDDVRAAMHQLRQ